MHLSLFLGPISRQTGDDAAVIDLCLQQAVEAARAGFAMVTFGEQHFNDYEPYCNPFIMAGRLAPELGDTWFGTTIIPLPFHNPLRLAEDASIADLLLRGRFVMGMSMGRGGPVPDFATWGLDKSERQAIFDAKFGALTAALAHQVGEPPLVIDTPYDKGMLNGRLMPLSWRAGGPQLAMGTNTDATIEFAASRGMPLFLGPCLPGVAASKLARHRELLAASGAAPAQVARASELSLVTRNVMLAETDDEAWEVAEAVMGKAFWMDRSVDTRTMRQMSEVDLGAPGAMQDEFVRNSMFVQEWLIVGSPSTVAAQIKEYEASGVRHLNVRTTTGAYNAERMTRMHQLFLAEVLPQVNAQKFDALATDEVRVHEVRPPMGPGPGVNNQIRPEKR